MGTHHHEESRWIPATSDAVFAFVDDHARFSSHMTESSWMMGGGRMDVDLDEGKGQSVGSHVRLSGRLFGVRLFLDEVVVRRAPPIDKVWETVGRPRLLVIGSYSMGVHITPERGGSRLRVFIDFQLPDGPFTYWLGWLLAGFYARWCVDQMLTVVVKQFAARPTVAA